MDGLSITAVAAEVGFSDVNYFSRLFRRIMGVSPRKFREKGNHPIQAAAAEMIEMR